MSQDYREVIQELKQVPEYEQQIYRERIHDALYTSLEFAQQEVEHMEGPEISLEEDVEVHFPPNSEMIEYQLLIQALDDSDTLEEFTEYIQTYRDEAEEELEEIRNTLDEEAEKEAEKFREQLNIGGEEFADEIKETFQEVVEDTSNPYEDITINVIGAAIEEI